MADHDMADALNQRMVPFGKLIGLEITEARSDRVVGKMTVTETLCTTPAVLHGGAIMAFADTLGAGATILNLPEGKSTTTVESKTNFLAPAPVGTAVTGECTPLHRGKRIMVWQTRLSDGQGRSIAVVTQTQLVI